MSKNMNEKEHSFINDAIIDNGQNIDIDISKISSCSCKSMSICERKCSRYYGCSTIAYANDLLIEYENQKSIKH